MSLPSHSLLFFSPKSPLSSFPIRRLFFRYNSHTAPWLHKWHSPPIPNSHSQSNPAAKAKIKTASPYVGSSTRGEKGPSAIERIVHRLRNLGLGSDDDESSDGDCVSDPLPWDDHSEERLGDMLKRSWPRPDSVSTAASSETMTLLLPWERGDDGYLRKSEREGEGEGEGKKKKRVKAPTLAELAIQDSELRRLRREGMILRERVSVPKAGLTQPVLEKIHQTWRKSELVRLKFHETLAQNMKTAHEIVERRTGGLVIWKSGSVMVVYRGANYEWPSKSQPMESQSNSRNILHDGEKLFVPDVTPASNSVAEDGRQAISSTIERTNAADKSPSHTESKTEDEAEYNSLLDGLGPRFVEWWGTGFLPVDADLLPPHIPGYKTPFRLLPTGMRPRLTNAEMTRLRKLARSLPCHFALGRNRNHHGLAAAIVKLWEKSIVVKIAVKRGIQNTNNKLMAEELKKLTGGILLLRNKYYIVMYRGKDFIPTSVAVVLAEREELTKDIQDVEERARISPVDPTCVPASLDERQDLEKDNQDFEGEACGEVDAANTRMIEGQALAGTLTEFHEAQARWGREISAQDHEKMKEEAARAKTAKMVKRIEHKLSVAQAKKLRAERLLAKIEASLVPAEPSDDQETITNEERFMFRRIGLRMKAYLPLGIRGVFDGVIENMHLHWKHRELVKLISKQKTLSFVEDTARLLEYESGGILVAIERVPKGYVLIYYRGKNYQRPINLRPRNLLTKAKALKRSVAMQRHEALSQHIVELESTIEKMKSELDISKNVEDESSWASEDEIQYGVSKFALNEDESSFLNSDDDDDDSEYDDKFD